MQCFSRVFACVVLVVACMSSANAEDYPARPVRIIVGYAAGSGPDLHARTVAQQLSQDLHQQFYVENRLGANGTIAARTVVQAEPDGHTLLFSSSSITPTPYIYKNLGYDPVRDLAPVATVGLLDGYLMLVNPSLPAHNVSEFIAYAKNNHVDYGTPGVGNILHLVSEIFAAKAGISMQHIPYKGASEVQAALLGQNIQVMFVTPPSVIGVVKAGQLRALAFTGEKPFPEFPDVPLMKASLPDFHVSGSWDMFFAPVKTPPAIVNKLNDAIHKAVQSPAVAPIMARDGYVPDSRSVEETAEFFRQEVKNAGDAVRAANIQPN